MFDIFIIQDWAGWLLLISSFLMIVFVREARERPGVTLALFFVLVLHHLVALTNAYIATTIGAEGDATGLHEIAAGLSETLKYTPYDQFLKFFYNLFGASHLFGEELSVAAFLVSCFVFLKICRLLDLSEWAAPLLVLFGALPSMVFFGSVTLREPWQILFFILAVYYGLLFHLRGKKPGLLLSAIFALAMGPFHVGLLVYAGFMIFIMSYWLMYRNKDCLLVSKRRVIVAVVLLLLFLTGMLGIQLLTQMHEYSGLKSLSDMGIIGAVKSYRTGGMSIYARTNYAVALDASSWSSLASSASLIFMYYMFAPFPWQVENFMDLYAASESVLRLCLIIFAIVAWRRAAGVQRRAFTLLLLLYFAMEFLWSVGTMNYGTAMRHHIVGYWIIVIMGGPGLISFITNSLKAAVMHRDREGLSRV